jgi:hypothetical protein
MHIYENVSSLLRMIHFQTCRKMETHFTFSNFFFLNREVYEIMWRNIVEPEMPQMKITAHGHYMLNM